MVQLNVYCQSTSKIADSYDALGFQKKKKPSKPQQAGSNVSDGGIVTFWLQVFAGLRQSATRSTVDPNAFADWAKSSNTNVMNMMMKMGFKAGEGLGVRGQGIVEPIQAVVRPGRAAVGAYGKEAPGPKFGGLYGTLLRFSRICR